MELQHRVVLGHVVEPGRQHPELATLLRGELALVVLPPLASVVLVAVLGEELRVALHAEVVLEQVLVPRVARPRDPLLVDLNHPAQ